MKNQKLKPPFTSRSEGGGDLAYIFYLTIYERIRPIKVVLILPLVSSKS